MKTIDIKSLLIGTLLTATIFLGIAATSPTDKWDDEQTWDVSEFTDKDVKKGRTKGWEVTGHMRDNGVYGHLFMYRKRTN